MLARLKPGASVEQGQVQLQQMLNAAIRAVAPEVKTELKTRLVPIHEIYARRSQLRLLLVLGASVLLLLAACTNIVNLLLARIASQATETATRIALGASKARIMIHMVVESVVLALIGGALGIAIAEIGTRTLLTYAPDDVRLLTDNHLNLPVLLFSFAVSLLAGLACGILPAAQAFRRDIAVALQEGARTAFGGSRRARFHQVLIGVEIALSTLLLLSAGLLLHSFIKIMRADRGYEVNNIVTANIGVSGSRYSTDQQRNLFFQQLAQNIRAVPGVKAAGAISHLPAVAEAGITRTIFYANDTDFQGTVLHRPVAAIRSVVSGYLAASGISLRAGRMVSEQDQTPVAMISESLARQLWSGEPVNNAVGRTLREGDVKAPLIQVVGVVEDVRAGALDHDLPPLLYVPYQQFADEHMTLVMRTTMDQASAAAVLRAQVRNLDPTLPILSIDSMRQILLTSVSQRVFQMILTCVFALVALVLGSVGVYGVVSYSIACRTRDIGMRFALGAMRADVMRWLFGSTFRSIVIGHIIGLLGAVLCAGIFRSLLFGVGPLDPLSIGAVAAVLLLASALACYLPARRAAQLDPITALRHE